MPTLKERLDAVLDACAATGAERAHILLHEPLATVDEVRAVASERWEQKQGYAVGKYSRGALEVDVFVDTPEERAEHEAKARAADGAGA